MLFQSCIFTLPQFFSGWWFAIDAAACYPDKGDLKDVFHICGVFATISMAMWVKCFVLQNIFHSTPSYCTTVDRYCKLFITLAYLIQGLTPCPMASWGESLTQPAAWGTRERGSGSSLGSYWDLDHSSELVGYSSGNISFQVRECGEILLWHLGNCLCHP